MRRLEVILLLTVYLGGIVSFLSGATIVICSSIFYIRTHDQVWIDSGDGGVVIILTASFILWIARSMGQKMRATWQNTDKDKTAPDAAAPTPTAPTAQESEN